MLKTAFNQVKFLSNHSRRFISALYVTGDRASENYAVLTPYMDYEEVFSNREEMQKNINLRKINISFPEACQKFETFKKLELEKIELEKKREQNAAQLKALQKNDKTNEATAEALKEEGRHLRVEMKDLREKLYPIEDIFVHDFLKLPNKLHQNTPIQESSIIYRQGLPNTNNSTSSHLSRTDLIDFRDSSCYYLKKEAAYFDIHLPMNCVQYFLDNSFTQFVNPDFARTILLEAAGLDLSTCQLVEEEGHDSKVNLLHLTGGGSLSSFLGFIAKLSIYPTILPLKLIASGREYILRNSKQSKGLLTATQANAVQIFLVTENQQQLNKEFEDTLSLLIDIYKKFNIHFRIIYQPAEKLSAAESLRASIEMFSPVYDEYVEVGHLSNYGNYISKRLLFSYKDNKRYKFPCIAAGTVLDVSKIIACILENGEKLDVPSYSGTSDAVKNFTNLFV